MQCNHYAELLNLKPGGK